MSYSASSSPISIARRSPSSTSSSSPAWSPSDDLCLPGPVQGSRSSSFSSSPGSCSFTSWRAYGHHGSSRSSSASSFISDEELAVDDCSSSDDEFLPAGLQKLQQQHQRNKRIAATPAALCTDADDVEVLQRILAAGFTIADPAEATPPRVATKKSEKPRSPRGSARRTRSGNRSLKRSAAMSTILEVGE